MPIVYKTSWPLRGVLVYGASHLVTVGLNACDHCGGPIHQLPSGGGSKVWRVRACFEKGTVTAFLMCSEVCMQKKVLNLQIAAELNDQSFTMYKEVSDASEDR